MNPCSEDNRTWTSQPNQSKPRIRVPIGRTTQLAPLDRDTQFESELPPEIRRELEISPSHRWPARIPQSEQEIEAAMVWLRERGYLPPTEPEPLQPPPTRPPVVQAPRTAPPERTPRRGWGLIWLVVGGFVLWALLHNQSSQPSASSAPGGSVVNPLRIPAPQARQDVRRAVPVVPRAESVSVPVASPLNSRVNVGDWHSVTLLDGRTTVSARFEGWLPSTADLPNRGHFLGEEFATGSGANANSWIWLTSTNGIASWVDP
jgi:hypothetical protein